MKSRTNPSSDKNAPQHSDIRSACLEIQASWSDRERRKRAGLPRYEAWTPPMICHSQLGMDVESDVDA